MGTEIEVEVRMAWEVIDTGTSSLWVDSSWFHSAGGKVFEAESVALAAYGRPTNTIENRISNFEMWGCKFNEPVKVMDYLPSTMFIGRRFRRK